MFENFSQIERTRHQLDQANAQVCNTRLPNTRLVHFDRYLALRKRISNLDYLHIDHIYLPSTSEYPPSWPPPLQAREKEREQEKEKHSRQIRELQHVIKEQEQLLQQVKTHQN